MDNFYWPSSASFESPSARCDRITRTFEEFIAHVTHEELEAEHGRLEIDILHAIEQQSFSMCDQIILVTDANGYTAVASLIP